MEAQPSLRTLPGAHAPAAHAPKAKPDARPMRLALGAGGLAAFSALATAIVLPPRPAYQAPVAVLQQPTDAASPTDSSSGAPLGSGRPVRYVQLLPGQTAPPGASVIPATVPTSGTLVVTVPAPGNKQAAQNPPPKQVAQQPAQPPAPQPVAQATPAPKPKPAPTPIIVKTTQSGVVVP